jgi:hypothetical protein
VKTRRLWYTCTLVVLIAVAIACGKQPAAPASPSAAAAGSVNAAADGSTLKATAPTLQSPIKGVKLDPGTTLTLVVGNATAKYSASTPLSYRFQIFNASGAQVYNSPLVAAGSSGTTSHVVTSVLDGDQTYSWQARVEYSGAFGPWSARESFIAPVNDGYIKDGELYDPLINGKTVGEIHGPVTFIPGVGVQLLTWDSYISYQLPNTLLEGEYSLLVTNMPANTKGGKQKVMGMAQGYDDFVTNDRRVDVGKRGDPPGMIDWRFLTHDDRIETGGSERVTYPFNKDLLYFYNISWRNNHFQVTINEGGVSGKNVYDYGKDWKGRPYDPNPHVIFVGVPVGRSGSDAATVENTVYRQIWVSSRSRPAFANK